MDANMDTLDTDEHKLNLQGLCRICGRKTLPKDRTSKFKFSKELDKLFGINVNEDDSLVHPNFLCNACRCFLYRKRQSKSEKSPGKTVELKVFAAHSEECEICSAKSDDENTVCGEYRSIEKDISTIIELFSKLKGTDKIKCMNAIIEHLYKETTLKLAVEKLSSSFPYRNLETLKALDLKEYLGHFDNILVSSLLAFTDQTLETVSLQSLIPILESIYRLSDPSFIGAWSFLQNLIVFSSTKSKQACNIVGTAIPGSRYSTIASFLSDLEMTKEAECPKGDLVFMFDNEQVIGKSWNVTANNKVKMSVITNVAVVEVTGENGENLQKQQHLVPGKWISTDEKEDLISKLCHDDLNDDFEDVHYQELYQHLEITLQQVQREISYDKTVDKWVDFLDKTVAEMETETNYQKCPRCKCIMDKNKRKCIQCQMLISELKKTVREMPSNETTNTIQEAQVMHEFNNQPEKLSEKAVTFGHVKTANTGTPYDVILLDPVFVNPNSVESIKLVLRHIGKMAKIRKYMPEGTQNARLWTFVCCDGLPHSLVRKLVEEFFMCNECKKGVLGIEAAQKHERTVHSLNKCSFSREFDWVYLITGDGHFEMNLMKSFVQLNWSVFMKSFVEVMGWKSDKAQLSAYNCSDNHKTYQMILIFHLGTMLELVRPYVEVCCVEKKEPSAENFISYVKQQDGNANFMYLFEMVCKYTQGIINMRMALRRNNFMLLRAAKFMTKELFHGRNHPKYQDLEMYEQFVQNILPDELQNFFDSHCSLSKSGHPSKGQGYDFVLEEENKSVKSWLKRGVPTETAWLAACRNHQSLKKIRGAVLKSTGLSVEGNEKAVNLDEAITQWRLRLRQTEYMKGDKHGSVLTSISAEVLDQELSKFSLESRRKRAYRMIDMFLHLAPPSDPTLHHPVYVLPSEREKFSSVEALTVSDIDSQILDIIDCLNENCQEVYLNMFRKIRSLKKQQHIQFLNEISEVLLDQLPQDNDTAILGEEETDNE